METFKEENEMINRLSLNLEECVQNCSDCYTKCISAHVDPEHVAMLRECAVVASLAASSLRLGSDFSHDICGLCARLCEACANRFPELNEDCQQACLKCAESCRKMEH